MESGYLPLVQESSNTVGKVDRTFTSALTFKQHDEYDGRDKEFEESKEFQEFKEFKEVAVATTYTLPAMFCCRPFPFLSYNFLHARWLHACK